MVDLRVVEKGFRGDAANVQAGSAERAALFYACYLWRIVSEAMLQGSDGYLLYL